MRLVPGQGERGPVLACAVVLASLTVLAFTALTGASTLEVTLVVLLVMTVAIGYRSLLAWRVVVALLILVMLFIPIRRYAMPGDLPFELEPYRVFAGVLVLGWIASLLVDPRVRLRRTGFEGPIALIAAVACASILTNPRRVIQLETDVVKKLMFFGSFILILYLVVSVTRRLGTVEFLVKALVGGGAVVAALAVVEARTGYNPFNHFSGVLPLLRLTELPEIPGRGARLRVYASAQHPIALSAALVMLTPLALYLAHALRQKRWWLCALLLALGCLATVSRTGILMLAVVVAVFLWLRPGETRRLWPALLPALIIVHLALPGTIGSFKESFFPEGGLIAEQQKDPGWTGSGRIADLTPSLEEFKRDPLVGQGFGTRIVDAREGGFRQILDNEWLGTLLEIGAAGVLGWLWLFGRAIRRFGREAKRNDSLRGWLLASITASTAAYAVGMFTYDAFSFIQVTFLLFVLLGIGASLLADAPAARRAPSRSGRPAPPPRSLEYA